MNAALIEKRHGFLNGTMAVLKPTICTHTVSDSMIMPTDRRAPTRMEATAP